MRRVSNKPTDKYLYYEEMARKDRQFVPSAVRRYWLRFTTAVYHLTLRVREAVHHLFVSEVEFDKKFDESKIPEYLKDHPKRGRPRKVTKKGK